MVLLESSAACWTTLIQDYGSIATLVALVTLIGIGFLLGAMLRGVMPRSSSKRGVASKERKKKKRKGHYHLRRGRIRQPHFRSTTSPIPEEEDEEPKEVLVADNNNNNNNAKNQSVAKLPRDETPKESPSRSVPEPTTATAATTTTTTTSAAKPRKYSYSTTDSTLPDDVSCGSTSVVSFASAPTAVTMTSASEQSGKSTKSQEEPKRRGNSNSSSNKKQKSKRSKQQDRSGSSSSHNSNNNSKRSGQKKNRKPVSEAVSAGTTTATKDQGKRADGVRGSRKENRLPLKARTQNDSDGKSRLSSSSSSSSQRVVPNPVDSFFSSSSPSTLQFAHDNNNNDNNSNGATHYHNNTLPAISQNFSATIGAQPAVSFASSSPSSVRYEQDHPHSFFSGDTGCSAEKMELAAFLARVGITGSACADFIASVTDVEALGRLSEAQFRSYGVSVEQKGLISSLLEERRRPLRVSDQRLTTTSSGVPCYGYGVPDYARSVSFAQGDGRYTPGKIELAGFLAQVGLMGSDCADLLATVEDVDTLGRFTDAQYRSYGVSREKQTQIAWMLEQRRRSRAEQLRLWTAPPLVRPPPGLATTTSSYDHLNPFSGSFGEQPTSRNLLIPTASSPLFAQRAMTAVEAEEESRIEVELQELGGQMVGSVLDF